MVGLEIKRELIDGELASFRQVLLPAAAALGGMVVPALNRLRVTAIGPYVLVGLVIWVCVLKSGIHATLAGVITALAIPMLDGKGGSPLQTAEHALHPWVTYLVLPVFAFANAGVFLGDVTVDSLLQTVPLGIAAGLLLGKPVGVLVASWLMIHFGGARLPEQSTWRQFGGVAVLCGVGFTMSLFIGSLAFEGAGTVYASQVKIGVLLGSLTSAALAVMILAQSAPVKPD